MFFVLCAPWAWSRSCGQSRPLTGVRDHRNLSSIKVSKEVERRRGKQSEIVLLHDGGHLGFGADRGFTVEATKVLLNKYADKKFVAIPDLTR